jgi:all-trans-8'-apo-beta-carotenal 15,15'-oxygenase
MAFTTNLFWGQGERDHQLDVVEGHWPTDIDGSVFIVGPDKREPGGHWFAEQGLLCRIDVSPDSDGRIGVRHRRVETPLARLRKRFPKLFKTFVFMEVSPFGLSNLANTNVQQLEGRLFVGYDAGRPVEMDPDTMEYVTAVGGNDEWFQAAPGLLEPAISVAAHPGPDFEEGQLYFVNYSPMPVGGGVYVASWDLEGPIRKWRVEGMSEFDSIHDIKVTRDYLVFCDLPFAFEPNTFTGGGQTRPNKDTTSLWIVSKADLASTPEGETVPCREVTLPMPTGHISLDYENPDGQIRMFLEHIPVQDLMIMVNRDETGHFTQKLMNPNHEGLVTLAVQPGCIGRYEIDGDSGEVASSEIAWDPRFWGAVLATKDESTAKARGHQGQLWYSSLGYDPALVPETWWRLYSDAGLNQLVDPHELPTEPVPAGLARFDRESMKVAEVFSFPEGSFPHPPTFVPRRSAVDPDDGYVICVVHQDGAKEVWAFDAGAIERGPLAKASAPDFNPPLLLHSCWMPEVKPRRSSYRIPTRADAKNALKAIPGHVVSIAKMMPELKRLNDEQKAAAPQ